MKMYLKAQVHTGFHKDYVFSYISRKIYRTFTKQSAEFLRRFYIVYAKCFSFTYTLKIYEDFT